MTTNDPGNPSRCAAAHPDDTTACLGPADAVRVLDATGVHVTGCVHHAAAMLAAVTGARVYPESVPGAAIVAHQLAAGRRPFDFAPADTDPDIGGADSGADPGPVPPIVEPDGPTTAVLTGGQLRLLLDAGHVVALTSAGVGHMRLTVQYPGGSVSVTLTADQADTLAHELAATVPVPYQPVSPPDPDPAGHGPRW